MDRRVRKTRTALRASLLDLVHERGWRRVSVQDVCARADVGRSTFYTHFADREELLLSGFDDLKLALRASRSGPFGFVGGLVAHVDDNRALARHVMSRRGGPPVRPRMMALVVELMEEELAQSMPAGPRRAATARLLAGGLVDLLLWRLEEPGFTAAETEALFRAFCQPLL
jgi:AcrR family transcriptional regulator